MIDVGKIACARKCYTQYIYAVTGTWNWSDRVREKMGYAIRNDVTKYCNYCTASIHVVCGREIKRTCSMLKNRRYMYSVDKNETKENKIKS